MRELYIAIKFSKEKTPEEMNFLKKYFEGDFMKQFKQTIISKLDKKAKVWIRIL